MKAKFFSLFLLAVIGFLSLSNTADAQVKYTNDDRTSWVEVDAKSGKSQLHITCNASIDGMTFERPNVGDDVILHFSDETGVEDWDWYDDVVGWLDGDPNETLGYLCRF